MAHSIVKVTDGELSDRLLLVVDPDGTVTPDKETVRTYLNSRPEGTDFEVMHVNKINENDVDLSLQSFTYVHNEEDVLEVPVEEMDEISRNLHYFRMDHDYTPLTSPKAPTPEKELEVEDELAQTLSMLDGNELEGELMADNKVIKTSAVKLIRKIAVTQTKGKTRVFPGATANNFRASRAAKVVPKEPEEELDESFEDTELYDEDNDSDFELESPKAARRRTKRASRSQSSESKTRSKPALIKVASKPELLEVLPKPDVASPDKKTTPQKKEKKIPKPIPDDFALFSSPDIIRRVAGKPEPESPKPVQKLDSKTKRLSVDGKHGEPKQIVARSDSRKSKEHERSGKKERRQSGEARKSTDLPLLEGNVSIQEFQDTSGSNSSQSGIEAQLEPLPNTEDIRSIIGGTSAVFNTSTHDLSQLTDPSMNLEAGGLDIDQSILDNISSDLISEDILYQVAQSLADNTELQNVIDKSLVDGNLVLDPALAAPPHPPPSLMTNEPIEPMDVSQAELDVTKPGTQIVRPDGRIVVIPPIERPTTRSRNRRNQEPEVKQAQKMTRKPLDEEHVSGNELDSESDKEESQEAEDEEEDEDEDDPDKLWCICNQPHNNRFMICCDTCEEWYHGKCVNVTKAMGQMMESEGKEWICLFCKDATLQRPSAAARRIRKASRTSTDSTGSQRKSSTTSLPEAKPPSPACIVCGKPSRSNSIYCSDKCILKHAQGVEKVVVFERRSGKILSGANAPSAANLEKWLKEHPGFEAVRSTSKPPIQKYPSSKASQSRLKLIKNPHNEGVSLALQKKGVNIGVLHHAPKDSQQNQPILLNKHAKKITGLKIISKQQVNVAQLKTKVINALPINKPQVLPQKPTTPQPQVKVRTVQTVLKPTTPTTKERPLLKVVKTKSIDAAPSTHQKQENIRDNVKKTIFEQLTNRLKIAEDLKLTEDEVHSISTEIESQLYKCFGDTGQKYRNKYRSLIFNIKDVKNQTLWRRICEKTINPYQLVRLSPDDLASQELALWRERETKHQLDMIKKSELELLNCNRSYVFKTHKGEQVFEDDRPKETVDSTEVITALSTDSTSSEQTADSHRGSSKEKDKRSKHSRRDRSRDVSKDRSRDRSRDRKSSKDKERRRKSWDRHKRSRSRDRSKQDKRSRSRDRHRRSSHKSSRHKKENHNTTDKLDKKSKEILEQLVDKQIVPPLEDRLWKHVPQEETLPASKSPTVESESDHEPTSTVTIPTPPQIPEPDLEETSKTVAVKSPVHNRSSKVEEEKPTLKTTTAPLVVKEDSVELPTPKPADPIWTGVINMVDVAQISIAAQEVSGDCSGLGEELPPTLDIVGRISPDTVWDYIGKMKCSNSKMISLLSLKATNEEEQMPYIALYSYLSSRKRLGVVKSTNKAVKDFYILPLSNQKPIPQALLPINGPGFEETRPPLLLGIIVRDKRKRPATEGGYVVSKRIKTDLIPKASTPPRSYTPPPSRDPRIKAALPLPATVSKKEAKDEEDMDEPYSPADSDPDTSVPVVAPSKVSSFLDTGLTTQILEPFTNKFDTIPGLEDAAAALPLNSLELQRKMAELDQKIAMEKAVIDNMSQDIASSAGGEMGPNDFSNIALPSDLQQILDSIKSIGPTTNVNADGTVQNESSDLTIPLLLPKISSRTQPGLAPSTKAEVSKPSPTIPLNLPKLKSKPTPAAPSATEVEKPGVLSSLTEEDLIRKAAEMLGENEASSKKEQPKKAKDSVPAYQPSYVASPPVMFNQPPPKINLSTPPPNLTPPALSTTAPNLSTPPPSLPAPKRSKIDLNQPPIPGLEDEP